jgi:Acetyltransferase (GNAT) domain
MVVNRLRRVLCLAGTVVSVAGSRVAARNFVRQAEAAGHGGNGQRGMFQIILRETGEVVDDVGFHGPPDEAGTVEIGYSIVEQYRGRGLVGESAVDIWGLAWSRPGLPGSSRRPRRVMRRLRAF